MLESMKSTLIGLFIAIGGILVVGIILFLQPSVGDGKFPKQGNNQQMSLVKSISINSFYTWIQL